MIRLTNSIKRADVPEAGRVMEIVSLAYINNSIKWKFSLHEHADFCEAVYVANGEGEYTVDSHVYHIEEGTIVLINQKTGHIQGRDIAYGNGARGLLRDPGVRQNRYFSKLCRHYKTYADNRDDN